MGGLYGLGFFYVEANARIEGLPIMHSYFGCCPFPGAVLCSQLEWAGKVLQMKCQPAVCMTGMMHMPMPFFSCSPLRLCMVVSLVPRRQGRGGGCLPSLTSNSAKEAWKIFSRSNLELDHILFLLPLVSGWFWSRLWPWLCQRGSAGEL